MAASKAGATSCGQLGLEMSVKPSGQTIGGCFSISTTLGIAWFSNKIVMATMTKMVGDDQQWKRQWLDESSHCTACM